MKRPWLDQEAVDRLEPMLAMLADDPASLSSVTDPDEGRDTHLIDSLSGLSIEQLCDPALIADIGSGAGFPGVPLALSLPGSEVEMIESVKRKTAFIDRVIEKLQLDNATTVTARSEEWAAEGAPGRERYDIVTARAVAGLVVLAELASPLLREGGLLIAWKGERETEAEERLAGLSTDLSMSLEEVRAIRPYEKSRFRHLYLVRKTGPTPARLPRRPGMARKRPL